MKIFVHDYGAYPFTRQLAEALARRYHLVEYCYSETTQGIKRSNPEYSTAGLFVHGIKLSMPDEKYSFFQRRKCEIEHGKLLAEQIKIFNPDVVISVDTPLDAQKYAIKAARNVNARFLFWMQDAISLAISKTLAPKYSLVGNLIGGYYQWMERKLLNQSDHVVLISEDFVPLMKQWEIKQEKMSVIPNWAPIDEIPVQSKLNPWALTQGLAGNFVFLFSGILGVNHNPALFVDLAQAFQAEHNVKIVIVVEGNAAAWLKEQKQALQLDNLILLPYQPAEYYSMMLGAADVLMSILNEEAGSYSVPSKVLSYMCAARPLLLAVPEENLAARLVTKNDMGLVSAPTDVNQWIINAKNMYLDKQANMRRGNNARKYAENQFKIEQFTTQFESLFQVDPVLTPAFGED